MLLPHVHTAWDPWSIRIIGPRRDPAGHDAGVYKRGEDFGEAVRGGGGSRGRPASGGLGTLGT